MHSSNTRGKRINTDKCCGTFCCRKLQWADSCNMINARLFINT
jgi:hypothetical protein